MKNIITRCLVLLFWGVLGVQGGNAKDISSDLPSPNSTELNGSEPLSAVSVIRGLNVLDIDCNLSYDPPVDRVGVGYVFDLIDNATGNIIATTQSDAAGVFEFTGLAAGNYTLQGRTYQGWATVQQNLLISLNGMDTQNIQILNCPYTPNKWSACIHGDDTPGQSNTHQELGMALVPTGDDEMKTLSTTNISDAINSNQRVVYNSFDNQGNAAATQRLNTFTEPGNHTIQNLHTLGESLCGSGITSIVGTTNDGGNRDVFFSELDANGNLVSYFDVTSTPDENEVVNDFINTWPSPYLAWVGTKSSNVVGDPRKIMVHRYLDCEVDLLKEYTMANQQGTADATGNSIIRIQSPLTFYPTAAYALTGSVDNEVYLLLLDTDLEVVLDLRYDVDSNPLTWETGIKLVQREKNIYIVGNSEARQPPNISANRTKRLFRLNINFSAPSFPVVQENHLYNIAGGGEEVVDMVIRSSGELILTGVTELSEAAFIMVNPERKEKTFLMGIDKFGNPLWGNQISHLDGSRPRDLALSEFFEISVVGDCWTNEQLPGQFLGFTQRYDQMIIRTDGFGRLTNNQICDRELAVTKTAITELVNDIITTVVDIPESINEHTVNATDYFTAPSYCSQGTGPGDDVTCQNLAAVTTSIPSDTFCCYQLDYTNNNIAPVYGLCLRIAGTATFNSITVDPAFTYTLNGANEITVRSSTGPTLPGGNFQDAVQYCVGNSGAAFGISYLWKDINGDLVCEGGEELEACSDPCNIEADFITITDCNSVQFNAIPPGAGSFLYEWDIDCNDPTSPDLVGQSVSWTFTNSGDHRICLKVTDQTTGCVATLEQEVSTIDDPPTIICPPSITISTDPGLCTATHQLVEPMVDDDCTTMFNIICDMFGATNGPAISPVTLNVGVTNINCYTFDESNQGVDCQYSITVEDNGSCDPDSCSVDFTWTANCGIVELDAIPSGTGPYTYEWDIDCDDPSNPELTGQSAGYTFVVGGVYSICLKVTDIATGCVATAEQEVFIELAPPVITCPPSITISTDPGLCTATHQLAEPLVTDDCTTMFNITCDMSGATNGPAVSPVVLNPGVTDISCFTVDENNLWAECTYSITVVDNEAPVITCAPPISVTVPGCEGGAFPFIDDPVVTDNCEGVEWTTDHTLGDFFACGTRTVTFTATDAAGNQSTCNVPVTVNCQCAEVENPTVECTDVDDQLFFSVDVSDLAASDAGCTITVTTAQGGVALSNIVITGTGPNYTVSGLIDLTAPPVPTNVRIVVNVNCRCFDGSQVNCSIPVNLPVPCCKEVSVESQEVCKTGGPVQIPLMGCNTLYDVQQVRWYVADAPCTPTTDFGDPFQVTNGCASLTLSPQYHNSDVCVYAEVTMGAAAGACTVLRSDVATITLCEPLGCSLGASQAYCWSGGPITPSPLTLNLDTNECQDSIRWFDPQGNPIPSANDQLSYQPPALDFTLPATECAQSYTYRVEVSNQCGTQSCSATIRLDNENAPVGTLALLTPDVNPLCYGEDVVVEYTPECAGDPERWDWFSRPDKTLTYTPLTDNGDRNPLYYSNRLYEDTWVMVEKTNGACPADSIEVFLDIIDTLALTSFTAAYDDPCAPSFVDLRFGFTPNPAAPSSSYTVTWYRNGQVIQTTTNVTGGGDAINYSGLPPLFSLAGNYYATVENSRCPGLMRSPVITLDPPMEVYALGPCFRCKSETITLSSLIINPINGFTCTYQWYDNGTPIAGETGPDLIIDPYWSGPFTFEVTCTNGFITCIQSDVYDLRQCGPVDRCMPATAFAEFTERSIDINRLEDQVIINAVGLTSNFNLSVNFRDGSDEQGYTVDDLPIIYTYQTTVSEDPLVTLFEYDDAGLECNRFTTTATANPAAEAIGLKLYPNPNEGRFTLDFNLPQAGDFTIAIFDLAGRKVLTEHHWLGTGQQQLTLRSDHLPTGSYLLRMVGSDFTAAAKFQRVR